MDWDDAEAAIRAHIETQWAIGSYARVPLKFEAELASVKLAAPAETDRVIAITVEGNFAEKSVYGSVGKRASIEGGIVFLHCFGPTDRGKRYITGPLVAMTKLLELRAIAGVIDMEGGNPPSPAEPGDGLLAGMQPKGNYYRVSGSVPFIIRGTR